ncbi:calcium homeostasis modulator protein 5-like [Cololabis saira]|uniref:calcium homeostasis modulator protein 5-like n=1 Tax=Cololabis saira TaxID=129043 RepID=UPI002AD28B5C|nr:calcium homeostasis modulator protein 5-like [Cololabis saira]XP_061574148.1 calcium homeostasis modulator protein 5-like [Cololabis saira]
MDKFQPVLQFIINQKTTIGYSFMALLTIGGERIFSVVSFQCPCNHQQNFAYGLTFLLGPAVVLLVLGLFLSSQFWRLYTGCCLNPQKLCPRGNCCGCFQVLINIFTGACVPPLMWLSVALLNGTFYECAISGLDENVVVDLFCKNKTLRCREELARVPCDRSKLSNDERMELLLMLRAQSQILGWIIIIIAAIVGLIGTCYKNCRSKVSYLQLTFWKRYVEKEKESFDSYTVEYATKLANRNLQSFFENKEPAAMSFPNHKAWEEISAYYSFSRSEQYYSTLQRFVERSDRDFSDERRPVLDLEHGLEMK